VDLITLGDGSTGELVSTISEIEVTPGVDQEVFAGRFPDDYGVTDRPFG